MCWSGPRGSGTAPAYRGRLWPSRAATESPGLPEGIVGVGGAQEWVVAAGGAEYAGDATPDGCSDCWPPIAGMLMG